MAAAEGIAGLDNVLIFSVASDGTDGSTDAVGGIVDMVAGILADAYQFNEDDLQPRRTESINKAPE